MKRFVKCFFELLTQNSAAGGQRHRSSADGFAVRMERTKAGGRFVKSCSLFSAAKWQRQKSRRSRGKSGDFFAPCAKKYYSSLDRLDSRNGDRAGIVLSGEICYT